MDQHTSKHIRDSKAKDMESLEITMQFLSRLVSLIGIVCMAFGFVRLFIIRGVLILPGDPTLPLPEFLQISHEPLSILAMSVGILMLALLPSFRVLISLFTYIHRKDMVDVLVAFVVFLELLFSIRSGF